jgi:hypothetical protein
MTKDALDALVGRVAVDRILARSRPILRPVKALIGKAPSSVAGDARLNTHFPGDRARTAALGCKQHHPRSLGVALRSARRAASRLKHLRLHRTSLTWRIIPFLKHESPAKIK